MFLPLMICLALAGAATSAPQDDSIAEIRRGLQVLQESRRRDQQEINTLREELRQVKGCKKLEGRLDWVESSVSETRGQLTELGAAVDRLRIIKPTLQAVRTQIKSQAEQMYKFHDQLELVKAQMAANSATTETTAAIPEHKETEVATRFMGRHWRHAKLAEEVGRLSGRQETVEAKIGRVADRMRGLEANLTAETGPLHASLLELLESVQSLENRMDTALPNIQKQLANADLTLAHQIQQTSIIKEEQDNQRLTVRALSVGLSTLQEANNKRRQAQNPTTTSTIAPTTKSQKEDGSARKLVDELTQVVSKYEHIVHTLPTDCRGVNEERTAVVRPSGDGDPLVVGCTEEGWTLVQRRTDGSEHFNRNWEEYAKGFGAPTGEFWIGNEVLHRLTLDNDTELRVDMEDIYGKKWRAEYSFFRVGSREEGFRLRVSGYSGNATDAMDYQNGMQFSAKDSDRDISNTHCASNYEGGWWFSHCQHANLNGRYNLGLTWFNAAKNEWIAVTKSTMKIRPGRSSRTVG